MTQFDATLLAFALFNTLRLLAYVPQITTIMHDDKGAPGVSCLSWALFAASHFISALYAHTNAADLPMAVFFTANGLVCILVVAMTQSKRRALIKATIESAQRAQ